MAVWIAHLLDLDLIPGGWLDGFHQVVEERTLGSLGIVDAFNLDCDTFSFLQSDPNGSALGIQ